MSSTFLSKQSDRAPLVKPGWGCGRLRTGVRGLGAMLTGRPQQKCCSPRCRAAKSRRARVPLPVAEAREIKVSLTTILEAAWQIKATLERYGSR